MILFNKKSYFMRIQIPEKKAGCLLVVLILVSLLHASISEATEFYLSVDGGNGEKHCDSIQIRENNIACIEQNQVVSYDLSAMEGIQIVDKGKIEFINRFTPGVIAKINASNQRNRDYEETVDQIEQSKIGYLIHKLKSVESFGHWFRMITKVYS